MASNPGEKFYNKMSQVYLPLSGGTMDGNITLPELSAYSNLFVGNPNKTSLGPTEDGNYHLSGAILKPAEIVLQRAQALPNNYEWYSTTYSAMGAIYQNYNPGSGSNPYDVLLLPKTRDRNMKTLATQEWTN